MGSEGPSYGSVRAPKLRLDGLVAGFWIPLCGMFMVFCDKYWIFLAREGLEMVLGWIPLHLDQVSAQMDHSGPIWDPFWISNFLKTHAVPK